MLNVVAQAVCLLHKGHGGVPLYPDTWMITSGFCNNNSIITVFSAVSQRLRHLLSEKMGI